jgi:hypothetical protein
MPTSSGADRCRRPRCCAYLAPGCRRSRGWTRIRRRVRRLGAYTFTAGPANMTVTGGDERDTITLSTGSDTVRYTALAQSSSGTWGTSRTSTPRPTAWTCRIRSAVDATIITGRLSTTTFDADLVCVPSGVAAWHAAFSCPTRARAPAPWPYSREKFLRSMVRTYSASGRQVRLDTYSTPPWILP